MGRLQDGKGTESDIFRPEDGRFSGMTMEIYRQTHCALLLRDSIAQRIDVFSRQLLCNWVGSATCSRDKRHLTVRAAENTIINQWSRGAMRPYDVPKHPQLKTQPPTSKHRQTATYGRSNFCAALPAKIDKIDRKFILPTGPKEPSSTDFPALREAKENRAPPSECRTRTRPFEDRAVSIRQP